MASKAVAFEKRHKGGSLWARGQTIDDVPTGYWEWFRKDGTKLRSGHFENGTQVGRWTTYDSNGDAYKVTYMKQRAPCERLHLCAVAEVDWGGVGTRGPLPSGTACRHLRADVNPVGSLAHRNIKRVSCLRCSLSPRVVQVVQVVPRGGASVPRWYRAPVMARCFSGW
jgi:hypothetical protein